MIKMHNKIKTLAENVGIEYGSYIDGYYTRCFDGVHRIDMEKFAELIVKECVSILQQKYTGRKGEELIDQQIDDCVKEIKEHFGIE